MNKVKCPKHDIGGGPCYCNTSTSGSNELLCDDAKASRKKLIISLSNRGYITTSVSRIKKDLPVFIGLDT